MSSTTSWSELLVSLALLGWGSKWCWVERERDGEREREIVSHFEILPSPDVQASEHSNIAFDDYVNLLATNQCEKQMGKRYL